MQHFLDDVREETPETITSKDLKHSDLVTTLTYECTLSRSRSVYLNSSGDNKRCKVDDKDEQDLRGRSMERVLEPVEDSEPTISLMGFGGIVLGNRVHKNSTERVRRARKVGKLDVNPVMLQEKNAK